MKIFTRARDASVDFLNCKIYLINYEDTIKSKLGNAYFKSSSSSYNESFLNLEYFAITPPFKVICSLGF